MRPDYCPIGNEPCQSLCDTPCSTQQRYTTDAMKVRQAVAQAVLQHEAKDEPVAWRTFDGEGGYDYRTYDMNENYANEWNERNPKHNGWVEPLYTAPPTQPEPVRDTEAHYKAVVEGVQKLFNDKRTQPAPVQEPVAWCVTYNRELTGNIFENRRIADLCKRNLEAKYGSEESREVVPIYTTPPQRTWAGLTDKELEEFSDAKLGSYDLCLEVEARLKEKNFD